MRLLKEILERDTISKWRVPSKSEPKKFHYVKLLIDGSFLCDCVFYQMKKKDCRHIRVAKKILIKKWQKKLQKG